jgi:hypothetical protein
VRDVFRGVVERLGAGLVGGMRPVRGEDLISLTRAVSTGCNPEPQSCVSRGDMRTRDEQFRTFFILEAERLRRLAIFLTGDTEVGADMAQETLARVYRPWGPGQERRSGPLRARTLDRPVGTVKSDIHRGLAKLRPLLEDIREPT